MTNSQRLAVVRKCLSDWVATQCSKASPETDTSTITSESMLIRNGFFCGRCFQTPSHRAVWFIEEDELKIYSHDGQLQCVLDTNQIDEMGAGVEPLPARTEDDETGVIQMPLREATSTSQASESIRRAA